MNFNQHYNLAGKHSSLSPSQYHWIRYTPEKFRERFLNQAAAKRGTEFHELAKELIRLGVKLPATKKTLNAFVNDAIGYKMTPEQVLFATPHCFGTADAISFFKNILRVFDLKTGESKTSVDQLLVYAAIFCIEYNIKPFDIEYDLRIYQSNEVQMFEVDPKDIVDIIDQIYTLSAIADAIDEEVSV